VEQRKERYLGPWRPYKGVGVKGTQTASFVNPVHSGRAGDLGKLNVFKGGGDTGNRARGVGSWERNRLKSGGKTGKN